MRARGLLFVGIAVGMAIGATPRGRQFVDAARSKLEQLVGQAKREVTAPRAEEPIEAPAANLIG